MKKKLSVIMLLLFISIFQSMAAKTYYTLENPVNSLELDRLSYEE